MNQKPLSNAEILNKIREGTQRRTEESQRLRQLKQERREELQEKASEANMSLQSSYIPYIMVSLVFLSFPLSEPTVDWVLVACFLVLNGAWTCFFRSSSWLNWLMMVVSNITLVRCSPLIPELPHLVQKIPPQTAAFYAAVNITAWVILYYAVVERRLPLSKPDTPQSRKSAKRSSRLTGKEEEEQGGETESLEEFARRKDRMDRMDWALSGMLLTNMLLLVVTGAIPPHVLFQSFRQIIAFLR